MSWKDYAIENAIKGLQRNVRADVSAHVPGVFKVIRELVDDEERRTLIDAETGEIILQGDTYHDKIEFLISGFFSALDFFGYPYECSTDSVELEEEVGA